MNAKFSRLRPTPMVRGSTVRAKRHGIRAVRLLYYLLIGVGIYALAMWRFVQNTELNDPEVEHMCSTLTSAQIEDAIVHYDIPYAMTARTLAGFGGSYKVKTFAECYEAFFRLVSPQYRWFSNGQLYLDTSRPRGEAHLHRICSS